MKIAFIQSLFFEYIGVMYLSACLKKNRHEVEVFIQSSKEDDFISEIVNFKPDIIGFSIMTGSQDWALRISHMIKDRINTYAVFGGPHPTFFPDIIHERGVDCVCIGESEETLVEIAAIISKGESPKNVKGAWFNIDGTIHKNEQRMLEQNLECLPFPDRGIYRDKYSSLPKSRAVFFAGRGCPFDCAFCFNHSLVKIYKYKGKYVRFRPVDNLISEIKEVLQDQRIKTIYFQDDTFVLKKSWIREFAEKYRREIGLPFICLIRADMVNEETIRMLSEANCKSVFLGIESGVEDIRNKLLKKKLTDKQIIECARLLKKYKIRFRTYNMVGLPGESIEDAFKTAELNSKIKTDSPWCSIFHPFPKTELAEHASRIGIVNQDAMLHKPSFFTDSALNIENRDEFANFQKLFFYAVKFPVLKQLIRRAIKLKPNPFFNMLFFIGYGWSYFWAERVSPKELFIIGKMNIRRLFAS